MALLALAYWALSRRNRVEPATPGITPQTEEYRNQQQIPPPAEPEPPQQPAAPQAAPPPAPAPEQQPQVQPRAPEESEPAEPRAAQQPAEPRAAQQPAEPQAAQQAGEPEMAAKTGSCGASFAFPVDERTFTDSQRAKLDQLASCLKASPSTVIELEGRAHPVSGASDERTDALALRRAQMIETELERRGVQSSQLRAKRSEPFCTDSSADCLAKNRSVVAVPAD